MPEETPNTPNPNEEALRRLERRLESLEYAAQHENKYWRGGLIAALVLVALSILIAGHHRHRRPPMGMQGCGGPRMMPYAPPPPPPYWGYGQGGNGPNGPPWGWHDHRRWDGPGSDGPPSPKG